MSTEKRRGLASKILAEPEQTPLLLQRCILSVMSEPYVTGKDDLERFVGATDICLARFEDIGKVRKGTMTLTSKGQVTEQEKRRSKDRVKKQSAWKRLIAKLHALEQQNG